MAGGPEKDKKVQKTEKAAEAKNKAAPSAPPAGKAPPSLPAADSVSDAAASSGPASFPGFLEQCLPEDLAALDFGGAPGVEAAEFLNHILAQCLAKFGIAISGGRGKCVLQAVAFRGSSF